MVSGPRRGIGQQIEKRIHSLIIVASLGTELQNVWEEHTRT
jgi:hypothetical protein